MPRLEYSRGYVTTLPMAISKSEISAVRVFAAVVAEQYIPQQKCLMK